MKRRRFVVGATAATLSAGFAAWYRVYGRGPRALPDDSALRRDPSGILDLLPGFRYRVLERHGAPMSDGLRVPGRPDGMACFALANGTWALMRNHELDRQLLALGPTTDGGPAPHAFDPEMAGGVSRVVVDVHGQRLSSNLVLGGTARNCAGGPSPWGWLSCEETGQAGHGYVFLCDPKASEARKPRPIFAYGRLQHEAVAIDARTNAAYLTEDRAEGCLYRFVPDALGEPFGKGRFQALKVRDAARFAVGDALTEAEPVRITWVDVPLAAGESDALREEAQARGAAIIRRGEGIWFGDDGVYVTSTTGGPHGKGQLLHVAIDGDEGWLKLIAQADDANALDMPDNITVTPGGQLIVCEDNHRDPHLRVITRAGKVLPFAHNALSLSEFAGACFSPDGRFLFVNMQEDGLTLVIDGPFDRLG